MYDLSSVREGWDEVEEQETRLLRQMTVQEGIGHLLALYRAFESQLQQTECLFRAERLAHLEELQRRLARLEEGRLTVEDLIDSLVALQSRLQGAGIPSAVIGAVAVSVWGEPRLTRDVDVKVLLQRQDAPRLLEVLASDYTSLLPDPLGSLRRSGILFVQDRLGTRLDLLLADVEFDVAAIRRARQVELQPGQVVAICRPEDLIIYKLISTRPRDHADAESVVRRQGDVLDDEYVLAWLRQFEIALDDSTLVDEYRRLRAR